MPRNTLLIIIFLGVFAAIVMGVNLGKKSVPTPPPVLQPTITQTYPKVLTDSTCGISYSYPDTLTKIDANLGGTTLINTKNPGEAIVIVCQTDIPRVPLPENKIETMEIGTVSAKLYHDASPKDGAPIDKLIFTHPVLKKTDVYVAGYGESFTNLIKTITITQ